jgi:HD-GYP domain-containing protein (c-di-GMP phosphodiesterase class II)
MTYRWLGSERQDQPTMPICEELASDAVILCWSRALDARAQLPEGFTRRSATLAVHVATRSGLSDEAIADLYRGILLHDIGMMQVPDSILRKPGPLTPGEQALVRLHPIFADEFLTPIGALHAVSAVPRYHHERWDGGGYPYGLRGDQIPIAARIFAVVGTWAAMTADRPYRRALAPERALAELADSAGTAFDPAVVDTFLSLLDQRVQMA